MKLLVCLAIFLSWLVVPNVWSQSCQKLFLSGKFVDTTRSIIMPSIQFTATRTANEIKIKANGMFSGLVKQNEIIEFYFEDYESFRFIARTKDKSCTMDTTLFLQPKLNLQDFEDITIYPRHDLQKLAQLRKDIIEAPPLKIQFTEAVNSPITALYNKYSRRAQNYQKMAEWDVIDRKRDVLTFYVHHYLAYDYIQLKDEDVNEFILYLDVNYEFLRITNEYGLMLEIKRQWYAFNAELEARR